MHFSEEREYLKFIELDIVFSERFQIYKIFS